MDNYLFGDGNWMLHRAWHAAGKTSKFPDTKVPNMILEWFCQGAVRLNAHYGALTFDGPKNFRKKLYPEYKANRTGDQDLVEESYWKGELMPPRTEKECINALIKPTISLFQTHGIVVEQKKEYEADDLLNSATYYFDDEGRVIYVMTRDKDLFQSVRKRVFVYMPNMGKIPERLYGVKAVTAAKKMTPRQFLHYQILVGDGIDNVPPIPKIGTPAKAMSIVKEYDKLSEYFATAEGAKIFKKYSSELHRNRELVTMSKKVWTIEDVKLRPRGTNKKVPALATLISSMSKRSMF